MEGLVAKIVAAREDNDCKDVVDTMREGLYSEVVVGKGLEAVVLLCEKHFTQSQISSGMRVRCRWKSMSGSFYRATIASLNDDGTYVIHYEDGDQDASVSLNRLSNDEIPRIFEESGRIPLLVEMLEEHGERSAEVAKNGLGVLKNLSTNDDIKKRIAEAGGIGMILRMMEVYGASDAVVAEDGCAALKSLACNDNNIRNSIAEAGGIEMIVSVMKKHGESNAEFAKQGCWALQNLARGNADIKIRIAEAGGIAIILSMIQVHGASNAEVAEYGCGALRNLADNNADNKKRIGEAGGNAMVLSMIETHGESSSVVAEQGCAALWNLIADAPTVEIFGETGSINAENKRKILAANGESLVERMKSTWASNEGVQKMADGALAILQVSGSEGETKSNSTTDGVATVSLISL